MSTKNINMNQIYLKTQGKLANEAKESYKKIISERKLPAAKKVFWFFITTMITYSLALIFIIPLVWINANDPWRTLELQNKNALSDQTRNLSWAFFAFIIILFLVATYLLSLFFTNRFIVKQQAYKTVKLEKILPFIFSELGYNIYLSDDNKNIDTHKTIISNNYFPEDKIQIKVDQKNNQIVDNSTNNTWVVNQFSIYRNNDALGYSLVFESELNLDKGVSMYGFNQNDFTKTLIASDTRDFKLIDNDLSIYATNDLINNENIELLRKFSTEFRLLQNKFGFCYNSQSKKMYHKLNTQNELFNIEKSLEVASALLNHSWIITEIISRVSALI
ncbi:hypothetical protein [Mycoplasma tauri]|uniref:hypothetical protein n=1 Tax=Mycoplasma tauri TaxID=547987 RepID=UPI001CBE1891|nr:hypothetical protein [Mycoplasma tauri]MBZ4203799.1 hypothetical protein [Mycoplasma tauri]